MDGLPVSLQSIPHLYTPVGLWGRCETQAQKNTHPPPGTEVRPIPTPGQSRAILSTRDQI
jgi:hypothetical protein